MLVHAALPKGNRNVDGGGVGKDCYIKIYGIGILLFKLKKTLLLSSYLSIFIIAISRSLFAIHPPFSPVMV